MFENCITVKLVNRVSCMDGSLYHIYRFCVIVHNGCCELAKLDLESFNWGLSPQCGLAICMTVGLSQWRVESLGGCYNKRVHALSCVYLMYLLDQ